VSLSDIAREITSRAKASGLSIQGDLAERLDVYLNVLGRWNRTINLTGLEVDPPDAEAIDRLIVEPLAAARFLPPGELFAVDIGSGGGSPALPIKIAAPQLRFALIEATGRKAAFLREAVRILGLPGVAVEASRFEEFSSQDEQEETADLVTVRAVRLDRGLVRGISRVLKPDGTLFRFETRDALEKADVAFDRVHALVPERGACLGIVSRATLVI